MPTKPMRMEEMALGSSKSERRVFEKDLCWLSLFLSLRWKGGAAFRRQEDGGDH